MKIIKTTILLLLSVITFAQEQTDMESFVNTLSTQSAIAETNAIRTFDNRYQGVDGHPYLLDQLKVLEVVTSNDSNHSVYGNYNLQDRLLVLLTKTNVLQNVPIDNIKSFSYTEGGIKSLFIKMDGTFVEAFFEGNNFSIFRSYSKELTKADFKGAYSSGKNQDSFKTEIDYRLSMNNTTQKVKLNFSSLAEVLEKEEKKLKILAKENKLKIKKSEDLISILKLFDETL
ncbi:MAG: hypothetical protein ABJG78_00500 [Cyclobacteriaceae bacterium]